MPELGINIDHVATLRQARREEDPDPIVAARICEDAGADSIVAHLREDRRHMNDRDIIQLRKAITTRFNLEASLAKEILAIAVKIKPDQVTLVPERRQEITTEGGLDVIKYFTRTKDAVALLNNNGIPVSLFIDADKKQLDTAYQTGARTIEIHTGGYAHARTAAARERKCQKIAAMTAYARTLGMTVNAGHGLKYDTVTAIARIPDMHELNIGHSIISRAVFVGLSQAVKEMKTLIKG